MCHFRRTFIVNYSSKSVIELSNLSLNRSLFHQIKTQEQLKKIKLISIRTYNSPTMRQNSIDDVHLDQFLKISNYEDTVKQLDIYYGIGQCGIIFVLRQKSWLQSTYYPLSNISVKRQLLKYQSPISGLFPVLSTDNQVGSVRDSVYCAAAVWGRFYFTAGFTESYLKIPFLLN